MFEKEQYTMQQEKDIYSTRQIWVVRDGSGKLVNSYVQKAAAARLLAKLEATENALEKQHKSRGFYAMSKIELIETIDPPADAMARTFHCAVCDKAHLQSGPIARVWVNYQEGYATQASPECLEAIDVTN